jgi:cbb3-type cytochrome oxidase maturation protein
MSVLFLVLPLTLAFSAAAVVAFLWSTKTGQLDDLDTPPLRMLRDPARAAARQSPPARNDED